MGGGVDFTFDETQREIAELTAAVLRREPEQPWKALEKAGLLTLAVPQRLGGDGLGAIETCVVLAEAGKAGVVAPVLATLALGVLPVVHMGTVDQQERLLSDNGVLTAALHGPVSVTPDGLCGKKIGVPYAGDARWILVAAGPDVFLVDPSGPGVTSKRTFSASATPEYTVTLSDVPGERLGDTAVLQAFALAGSCAFGEGLLAGALDLTSGHVRTREQFGKPLAAFQAVAQRIADVYVAVRTLHLATWSAVWRLGTGRDAGEALDVAAYWLAAELPAALHTCHHLHGGIGVDITYPMHRYYSLGKDLVRSVGGAEHRLEALGDRCSST
jgi:alkylation response protein AidB-like acyl-CoA dehydrogenase